MSLISFDWYVIYSKPHQEHRALLNLERQGYECYLPWIKVNKLKKGRVEEVNEVMFHRYLFIRLRQDQLAKSWGPIRSTLGVVSLVMIGNIAQKVNNSIIDDIRNLTFKNPVKKPFNAGDHVSVKEGPFKGLNGIFQIENGKDRVMILIELLGNLVPLKIPIYHLKKT